MKQERDKLAIVDDIDYLIQDTHIKPIYDKRGKTTGFSEEDVAEWVAKMKNILQKVTEEFLQ